MEILLNTNCYSQNEVLLASKVDDNPWKEYSNT